MVLTSDDRIALAERLAQASHEVEQLRIRLQEARRLHLDRADRRGLIERLSEDLRAAEARQTAASEALVTSAEDARNALIRARQETTAATYKAARAIVREMRPLVAHLTELNTTLDRLRRSVGNPSDIPPSFRPHLMSVETWRDVAARFTDGD